MGDDANTRGVSFSTSLSTEGKKTKIGERKRREQVALGNQVQT